MMQMMLFLRNLAGGTDKKPEDQAALAADKKHTGNHRSDHDEQVVALMAAVF